MQTGQIVNDGGYLRIRVIDKNGNLNAILDQTDDDLDFQCEKLGIGVVRNYHNVVIGYRDLRADLTTWKEN
ncbi:MAG: hypothetical protein ACPG5L_15885 [Vibrio gallaecicus]